MRGRRRRYAYLLCGILLLCGGCGPSVPKPEQGTVVSMYELLGYPERYDGERITVCGVLKEEENGYAVYVTRWDASYENDLTGFWLGEELGAEVYVSPSLEELNTQYVEITGTLQAGETGEGPAYRGTIANTEMITEAEIKVEGYNGPNSGYGYDPFEEFVKFEEEE